MSGDARPNIVRITKHSREVIERHNDVAEAVPVVQWDVSQDSRGLGDTIAKITTKVGIKPCGGCKQRQSKLNKLVPYK